MNYKQVLKRFILSFPSFREKYKNKLIASGKIQKYEQHVAGLESAEKVFTPDAIKNKIGLIGLVRDAVFEYDEEYISTRSYFPKYERFLKNNNLSFEYYDILASDWIEKAEKFDSIIWHTDSDPITQDIAQNKIFVLEKLMGKKCLPSFDEIWSYENKINAHYCFKFYDLPEIPTYVSHSEKDAGRYLNEVSYPLISKLSTGSASFGVEKIDSKTNAKKLLEDVFGFKGRETYFPSVRQKDYVYFQEFMDDATYDLRIVTIGDKAFGYYRLPQAGDFKASGSGIYEKKEIPKEALDLAFQVYDKFGSVCLATDLLYSEKRKQFYIIESSIFIGVDTDEQLVVNGEPGVYIRADNQYRFERGKFWIQELTLREFFERATK